MPTSPTPLPTIPPFPALADKATGTYNSKAYTWATEWDTIIAPALETLAETTYDNAVEAAASSTLAVQNTGTAIGYTFDTATADADPGAGKLRLNNATQNTATVIRADNTSAAGSDVAALLATFGTGTSTVKGRLRIQHATDATKWLIFDVTAVASPSGYKNITATCTGFSAASPFANGDALAVSFSTTGDKGDTGATGPAGTFGGTATSTAEFLTGANIASASTVNLDTATGNRVHITGTTTITAVTLTRGPRTVIFDGVLTLTHHATNNNLPGAANITTAAGDRAIYESDGTTVYCVSYIRANGTAVVGSAPGLVCLAVASASSVATVDFTSAIDSTYDEYEIHLQNVIPATVNTQLLLRTSSNAGSSFDATGGDYRWSTAEFRNAAVNSSGAISDDSIRISPFAVNSSVSEGGVSGVVRIFAPSGTASNKAIRYSTAIYSSNSSSAVSASESAGMRMSTSAVNAIRFLFSSGNIASGLFKLYGVRKLV